MLFTFPSRYLFAIDLQIYLALEGGPPRFKPDYTCPTLLRNTLDLYPIFADGAITLYGRSFQRRLANRNKVHIKVLQPHTPWGMVWAIPRSLATTKGISFDLFSSGTKMFQFSECPRYTYVFSIPYPAITRDGFPHSEISGSMPT